MHALHRQGISLITRMQVRGCAGVVTDGGFRDAMRIAELDMPSYHKRPASPTNLTLHEAIDINVPIGCGDVPVFPSDIVVGDDDSVIVIPAEVAQEIADEATNMTHLRAVRGRAGACRRDHHRSLPGDAAGKPR